MRNPIVTAGVAAVALALAVAACKSDKSTGPGTSSGFAGTYSGPIAGASTSGVLTVTIPSGAAADLTHGQGAAEFSVDAAQASVALSGTLKIAGGSSYPISGSFDNVAGILVGVTAGPYAITGGFTAGVFSGTWRNTTTGATGGFNLLTVPAGGAALTLCGVYTGSASGVWNLTIVGSSMSGEAASSSGALRLTGTFVPTSGAMQNIKSPDDATVTASGSLTTPANTASGIWSGGGGTGNWNGSAAACN